MTYDNLPCESSSQLESLYFPYLINSLNDFSVNRNVLYRNDI